MRRIRSCPALAGQQARAERLLREAAARAELADQALINYIALAPYSGDAWLGRPRRSVPRDIPLGPPRIPSPRDAKEARLAARSRPR